MAVRTHKALYEKGDQAVNKTRIMLCASKNQKEIYYDFEDTPDEESAPVVESSQEVAPTPSVPVPVAAAPVAAPIPPSGGGSAASIPDEPLKAVDTVRAIVAQKLKKTISEISASKTIKEFVGGKSTMQNEILGDLGAEFGSTPEKAEELPLDEMGATLNVGYTGVLGKHTNSLVSRMANSKMPGGFSVSSIKSYLSKRWGLGTGRTEGALLVAITMEPPKRLGSEGEAQAWLDTVAASYAQAAGISLSSGGGGGGASGGGGGAMIDNAVFEAFTSQQEEFVSRQVEVMMRYLKKDSREGHRLASNTKDELQALQDKLDSISRELKHLVLREIDA
jgi:3-oxoacyl-ACP reductase-like protein